MFSFSQSLIFMDQLEFIDSIIDAKKMIDKYNKGLVEVLSNDELNYYEFKVLSEEMDLESGILLGNEIDLLATIRVDKEEEIVLARFFKEKIVYGSFLMFYKVDDVYYSSLIDLNFSVQDSVIRQKYVEMGARRYYPITRFNYKKNVFEHSVLYYDFGGDYFGVYRLFAPLIKNKKQTFKINHERLSINFKSTDLFKNKICNKRFYLEVVNDYTLPFKMENFHKKIEEVDLN